MRRAAIQRAQVAALVVGDNADHHIAATGSDTIIGGELDVVDATIAIAISFCPNFSSVGAEDFAIWRILALTNLLILIDEVNSDGE